MERRRLLTSALTVLALAGASCSTLVQRAGQPTLIGDIDHGTPTHAVLVNHEGQAFRLPRRALTSVRLGGLRTLLWSPLTFYGMFIMAPLGAVQWLGEAATFDSEDNQRDDLLDASDEEEVDVGAELSP